MRQHTHAPLSVIVSLHPLRGRSFADLPAALRYVGTLHHARFVCVEIRNGQTWQTSGPAVTVSQDMIDYAAHHRREAACICAECDGTGWRDIKSPDDTPGYAYCSCPIGQRAREEGRKRKQDERAAELAADLPW